VAWRSGGLAQWWPGAVSWRNGLAQWPAAPPTLLLGANASSNATLLLVASSAGGAATAVVGVVKLLAVTLASPLMVKRPPKLVKLALPTSLKASPKATTRLACKGLTVLLAPPQPTSKHDKAKRHRPIRRGTEK